MWRGRIDDGAGDYGTDKGRRLADDAEQAEEEKLVAAGSDFWNHDPRVAVPRAEEESVVYIEKLFRRTGVSVCACVYSNMEF